MKGLVNRQEALQLVPSAPLSTPLLPAPRITRVLVPIDLSRGSSKAISYAMAISRRLGADVHFIHVVDSTQYLPPTLLMWPVVSQVEWRVRASKQLEGIAQKYSRFGEIEVHAPLEGCAHEEICRAARELKADLIIIATHGYTGYKRAFLGSTAERVVQFSPCPVLVVRKPYRGVTETKARARGKEFQLGKVVIPVDFSPCAEGALELGGALARDLGAKVDLVHAVGVPYYPMEDQYTALATLTLLEELRKAASREMEKMAARANLRGAAREVVEGSPSQSICDYASRAEADLIIVSTHGRSGLRHALIGSVAERIVRYAECPVLVVPARWAALEALPTPKHGVES
jgi:nucleotide-binding universal stress UspA family protein